MSLPPVQQISDFPIQDKDRKCTDVCCTIVGIAFSAALLILAFSFYNYDHEIKTSFPSDSNGRVCGFDLQNYSFIYFANFPKTDRRVCVSECPSSKDNNLKCIPTNDVGCVYSKLPEFEVEYYENQPQETAIGSFCVPKDHQQKQQLYEDIHIGRRFVFFKHMSSIGISCAIAAVISFLYLLLVQCIPKEITYFTFGFGSLIIIATIVFVMVFPKAHFVARVIFTILMALFLIGIFINWRNNPKTFKMFGHFMNESTCIISKDKLAIIYIPLSLGISVIFMLGIGFELKCLWSSASIQFKKQQVFYVFKGNTLIWSVLVFIQTIWGLSWIKQAFNFCIGGYASQWHFNNINEENVGCNRFEPLKVLFAKHFGSVVAGAFMNGWFSVFDYIFDNIRCKKKDVSEQKTCHLNFFDLIRSDSLAYIYVTGNPYCNSSRYCQYLCAHSPLTSNSQSISRSYRICAHFLIAGIVCIVNLFLQGAQISFFVVLVVFIAALFISTFFISFHADATEAIHIIFILDEYFATKGLSPEQRYDFNGSIIEKMRYNEKLARNVAEVHRQAEQQ